MVSSVPAPSEVPATVDITRYEAGKTLKDVGRKKSAAREHDLASTAVSGDHVVGPLKRMLATYRRMLLLALALGAASSLTSVNLPLTVINPRRACTARVTVVVCLSVCQSVCYHVFSHRAHKIRI